MVSIFSDSARSKASFGSDAASIHLVLVKPMMLRARAESIMLCGAEWGRRLTDIPAQILQTNGSCFRYQPQGWWYSIEIYVVFKSQTVLIKLALPQAAQVDTPFKRKNINAAPPWEDLLNDTLPRRKKLRVLNRTHNPDLRRVLYRSATTAAQVGNHINQ